MNKTKTLVTDVLVIGGGATGTGILRDCALRNIDCLLVEKDDIASGTTGRNHGLLHSGARYAVTDPHSARECISENRILKNIARHCVEETAGLFITLPEDELSFQDTFVEACTDSGIDTQVLTRNEALRSEPNANPDMLGAVKVPDGTLDPFRLCAANILDAKKHGGRILTYSIVTSLILESDRVIGAWCVNTRSREIFRVLAREVINAAGIWGQNICQYADLGIRMSPAKGSLLILDYRINNLVINRCRKPADADILVPGDTISLIGTTSENISYDQIDDLTVSTAEVDRLLHEGAKLAPVMSNTRVLRAYSGVRPLISLDGDASGRNVSRGIVLLDHASRDGMQGFTTITGGKLMTYRLMAEKATDLVAEKLGNSEPCMTAERPLPGSNTETKKPGKTASIVKPVYESARYRHGDRADSFLKPDIRSQSVICECEMVTAGEVEYVLRESDVSTIEDLRRRTRLGMGPCQGELCTYRAAGLFTEFGVADGSESTQMLTDFLDERWKGTKPVLWGDALREAEFSYWIYQGLLGASNEREPKGKTVKEISG